MDTLPFSRYKGGDYSKEHGIRKLNPASGEFEFILFGDCQVTAIQLQGPKREKGEDKMKITESELRRIIAEEIMSVLDDVSALDEKKKRKKPCKKAKGKKFVKRVNGRCRSYGQAGKAKDGGPRIRPGTKKAHAYCARSLKIKKCKNPPCANTLSRRKWKCKGKRSVPEE